jgi:hypothetical protein
MITKISTYEIYYIGYKSTKYNYDFSTRGCTDHTYDLCFSAVGVRFGLWLMVFNATFNNISVISWRSVLLVEETGVPGENH